MKRFFGFAFAMFFAVASIALVGGESTAVAGRGCHGARRSHGGLFHRHRRCHGKEEASKSTPASVSIDSGCGSCGEVTYGGDCGGCGEVVYGGDCGGCGEVVYGGDCGGCGEVMYGGCGDCGHVIHGGYGDCGHVIYGGCAGGDCGGSGVIVTEGVPTEAAPAAPKTEENAPKAEPAKT